MSCEVYILSADKLQGYQALTDSQHYLTHQDSGLSHMSKGSVKHFAPPFFGLYYIIFL